MGKNAEEQMDITSEKLISAKEEIGVVGNVYQEERRNVGKLRNELKEMDVQILSYKDEANKLTVKVRELEQIKRKSEERTNPEESEIDGRNSETSNIKTKEVKDRENLELRNKLKYAEEQMAITSEKLISAKEEIGALGNVY